MLCVFRNKGIFVSNLQLNKLIFSVNKDLGNKLKIF